MDEQKYDFSILFEKIEEMKIANKDNIEFDIKINEEIDNHVKYLKEFYDTTNQEHYEIITRS